MYDDFYQLTGRPFQLTPDPQFYFESVTHRKALSYLGYGLAQGEGFIVITGEVGSGKSTLAAHLMATIDRQRLTAAQIVTSRLDGGELVHMAARAFGLEVAGHDKATALASLEALLHEEARAGRRCLLVVDESQNLSVAALEELRMLSNFQLGAHPLLQILMLGQPEFRGVLQGAPELEQLRQRVIASHHLDAMEPGEIGPYVEHRLACVGWRGNPAFDPQVYADLATASGGIPRRINQIVNRLLLMGAVEQRTRLDAAMLQDVLADLDSDGGFGTAQARPAPIPNPAPAQPGVQAAPRPAPVFRPMAVAAPVEPTIDLATFERELARRDEQIAELQQAVIELSDQRAAVPAAPAEDDAEEDRALMAALAERITLLAERLLALEGRSGEQEQALRHVLAMLIEWIEGEGQQRAAA
ncbi:XrtA/PEP-CTERM system-associated ATPase [Novosphingobium percolationis]|uniref:XrtA/PEP-CTERM system-associated ATPase n=1 Tax=Novosphingobium percolationis TaxID=2871811 RepID=UPI001CD6CA06|nr:XrtA/PEP-CTERM system-associated ATPase [Novosphingobium percolationis]MCH7629557.1 AAA family ATPase [Pseudomonadota bacterium]